MPEARSEPTRFPPVCPGRPVILHGGDYNPDQWLHAPEVLADDPRLMRRAGINSASIGIFAWAALEPREGDYQFDWLDRVMDTLAGNGIAAVLATPSGAKPHWLALKYPEVRRIDAKGQREPQAWRHNHCYTSPVYREKCVALNRRLAERYAGHPALAMWHVSNEYGGECHCDLCKAAFRTWLRDRYGSLDALNHAWWSSFWSHRYGTWEEIEYIDPSVHGLALDWKRFVTHQTVDFFRCESAPLRQYAPGVPVTVNMMGTYDGLDYWKFAPHVDVISYDVYPGWHTEPDDLATARWTALLHDLNRSLKRRPFVLMECTPSNVNWQKISPLKRPGVNRLAAVQSVAHGSDAVMYFQFRKGRGAWEKFHGAVVDHAGHERTRVFEEVAGLGAELARLAGVVGTPTPARAALVFDWESRWAFTASQGPRNVNHEYERTAAEHYGPLWRRGIATDVIDADQSLDPYDLVIAPLLYMLRPGVGERLAEFVRRGGTLVTTYLSGVADASDLVFTGGLPGGAGSAARELLGIWSEEVDALPDHRDPGVTALEGNGVGLSGRYAARHYAEVVHLETARALAVYAGEFYAGRPAVTVNPFGRGAAYYVASRNEERFTDDLLGHLARKLPRAVEGDLPAGVSTALRSDGREDFVFLMNFTPHPQSVALGQAHDDVLAGGRAERIDLGPYDARVLRRPAQASTAR